MSDAPPDFLTAAADRLGTPPTGVATAPGRVNLMGDHTDYNGLPVLPMAINRALRIAFRPLAEPRVVLHNLDPGFPSVAFPLAEAGTMEAAGAWGNYPRAAAATLRSRLGLTSGLEGVVGSELPAAAGLSSSTALVVATALALLQVNRREVPADLAGWLAAGERLVGTEGGAMDQAIILGARAGHAMRIGFVPKLTLTPVPVPTAWRFLVGYSLVPAPKAGAAREVFNARVAECRKALDRLRAMGSAGFPPLHEKPLDRVLAAARPILPAELYKRFHHVLSEADRVERAVELLAAENLRGFGRLLDVSHTSLQEDYQVSCEDLDELVSVARRAGAVGARLTGAGLGGCMVAVVPAATADRVIDEVWARFYRPREVAEDLRARTLFLATPVAGARVDPLG